MKIFWRAFSPGWRSRGNFAIATCRIDMEICYFAFGSDPSVYAQFLRKEWRSVPLLHRMFANRFQTIIADDSDLKNIQMRFFKVRLCWRFDRPS